MKFVMETKISIDEPFWAILKGATVLNTLRTTAFLYSNIINVDIGDNA